VNERVVGHKRIYEVRDFAKMSDEPFFNSSIILGFDVLVLDVLAQEVKDAMFEKKLGNIFKNLSFY
jgi:hypothetical protein